MASSLWWLAICCHAARARRHLRHTCTCAHVPGNGLAMPWADQTWGYGASSQQFTCHCPVQSPQGSRPSLGGLDTVIWALSCTEVGLTARFRYSLGAGLLGQTLCMHKLVRIAGREIALLNVLHGFDTSPFYPRYSYHRHLPRRCWKRRSASL